MLSKLGTEFGFAQTDKGPADNAIILIFRETIVKMNSFLWLYAYAKKRQLLWLFFLKISCFNALKTHYTVLKHRTIISTDFRVFVICTKFKSSNDYRPYH